MISTKSYLSYLSQNGSNLGNIRKNQSDMIIDQTFTGDPTYKRVYILTKDGWKFEDAKYQFHTARSILRDDVDFYLQFRPKHHYPIGSYVIIPDDTSPDVNLNLEELKNPFLQPVNNRTQWWLIVGRDDANAYVRYNILKCNWNFQWIWNGEIQNCYGVIRNASSYTSGVWRDEISASLDNLTGMWLPDTYYVYGDSLKDIHLDDNRTIMHEQRFILSNNDIDPKVYQVTKIIDLSPQGILKITVKQDELNEKRDNIELRICDYYKNDGDSTIEIAPVISTGTSTIKRLYLNDNNELEYSKTNTRSIESLRIGEIAYFGVTFSEHLDTTSQWNVTLSGSDDYTEEQIKYYEGLVNITHLGNNSISIRLSKAKSLSNKHFTLSVSDINGNHHSSIELEVENYET